MENAPESVALRNASSRRLAQISARRPMVCRHLPRPARRVAALSDASLEDLFR